jgi:hypothetical protein
MSLLKANIFGSSAKERICIGKDVRRESPHILTFLGHFLQLKTYGLAVN